MNTISNYLRSFSNKATDYQNKTGDAADKTFQDTRDRAVDTASNLQDGATNLASNVSERSNETLGDLGTKPAEYVDIVTDNWEEVLNGTAVDEEGNATSVSGDEDGANYPGVIQENLENGSKTVANAVNETFETVSGNV